MNKDTFSRRIIVALVRDNPGVLAAIVGVIRRRGINIASLAVGHSEKNKFSRMTFVVEGQEKPVANISSQLNKLIDDEINKPAQMQDTQAIASFQTQLGAAYASKSAYINEHEKLNEKS